MYHMYITSCKQKKRNKMAKNKLHNINARVNDSLKIRVQAYALKNRISESEVLRLALKNFLQTNVAKAKRYVNNYRMEELCEAR